MTKTVTPDEVTGTEGAADVVDTDFHADDAPKSEGNGTGTALALPGTAPKVLSMARAEKRIEITEVGATIKAGATKKEFADIFATMLTFGAAHQFVIGDMYLQGMESFGEDFVTSVIPEGKYSLKTLQNYAWVSKQFSPERRRINHGVEWNLHEAVAGKSHPEQDEWLNAAQENGWNRSEIRKALQASKDGGTGSAQEGAAAMAGTPYPPTGIGKKQATQEPEDDGPDYGPFKPTQGTGTYVIPADTNLKLQALTRLHNSARNVQLLTPGAMLALIVDYAYNNHPEVAGRLNGIAAEISTEAKEADAYTMKATIKTAKVKATPAPKPPKEAKVKATPATKGAKDKPLSKAEQARKMRESQQAQKEQNAAAGVTAFLGNDDENSDEHGRPDTDDSNDGEPDDAYSEAMGELE